jgi:hypothetical protein
LENAKGEGGLQGWQGLARVLQESKGEVLKNRREKIRREKGKVLRNKKGREEEERLEKGLLSSRENFIT